MGSFTDVEKASNPFENDFSYHNNVAQADVSIRLGFLRKVYSLLFTQLLVTTTCAGVMFFMKEQLLASPNLCTSLALISFLSTFGFLIGLMFKKSQTPTNFVLLLGFTLSESVAVGFIVINYAATNVLQATALTTVATFTLMAYAMQSKRDFSQWKSGLCIGMLLLMIAFPLNLFLGSSRFEFTLALGGALLFSLMIIYDTHRLMHHCSPEDYIIACIELYLDILNLFIYLLRILKEVQKN